MMIVRFRNVCGMLEELLGEDGVLGHSQVGGAEKVGAGAIEGTGFSFRLGLDGYGVFVRGGGAIEQRGGSFV